MWWSAGSVRPRRGPPDGLPGFQRDGAAAPRGADAAVCALQIGGNPSSVHAAGRLARAAVEKARGEVAELVGAAEADVTFTSGGTEANVMALSSALAAGARRPIILMTEHDSIMATATASGLWVEAWPVSRCGLADVDWLRDRLRKAAAADGRPFAALSLANNETGVVQPLADISAVMEEAGGWLHVDAVQAAGKIPVDLAQLGADTMSVSGHKLGAPQGVGALVARPGAPLERKRFGGGQERGVRPGTENVSGIAGFGAAAVAARRDLAAVQGQADFRDAAADRLTSEGCVVAGEAAPRLPTTLCAICDGFDASLQVMALDLAGVMISAGAACSSGKVAASHVLRAMGCSGEDASSAIRVSGGWSTTAEDWDLFTQAWLAAHARHVSRQRSRKVA